jgi:hypothetical protein
MRSVAAALALTALAGVSAKTQLSQDLESELASHQAALANGPADDVSEAPATPETPAAPVDTGLEAEGPKSIKLQYHAPAQYPVHYPVAYPMVHPAFAGAYGAYGAYAGMYGHPAMWGGVHPAAYGAYGHPAMWGGVHPAAYAGAFGHPAFGAFGHPAFGGYPFGGVAMGTATANGNPAFQAFTGGVHPAAYGAI